MFLFSVMVRRPQISTLFPYTTLFRSIFGIRGMPNVPPPITGTHDGIENDGKEFIARAIALTIDSIPLKRPLIIPTIGLTTMRIPDLMPSQTRKNISLNRFKPDIMPSQTFEKKLRIPPKTLSTILLTRPNTLEIVSRMRLTVFVNIFLIPFHIFEKKSLMAPNTVDAVFFIPSQIPLTKSTIPFHTFSVNALISSQYL